MRADREVLITPPPVALAGLERRARSRRRPRAGGARHCAAFQCDTSAPIVEHETRRGQVTGGSATGSSRR